MSPPQFRGQHGVFDSITVHVSLYVCVSQPGCSACSFAKSCEDLAKPETGPTDTDLPTREGDDGSAKLLTSVLQVDVPPLHARVRWSS
eukprot:6004021-Amphidinium_carterae.1